MRYCVWCTDFAAAEVVAAGSFEAAFRGGFEVEEVEVGKAIEVEIVAPIRDSVAASGASRADFR